MSADDSDDKTRSYVPLTSGATVSHYQIIEKIGAGGMGEVYLAEDSKLGRKVALKFLPQHLCQNADCRARFIREAQASAKLDHPNVVAVFEVGEYNGRPFFAMQHVEGQTLKNVMAGKPLPIDRIIEIGIQVCEGLQAAHEKGITHRDIKPSNILIDSHGRARIVDFGLASVLGADELTKTGSTLGTIGYMSPEQVRGDKVDQRTDLFSFGVVLYEMITGHSPFKADSEAATLHAITNAKPDLLARYRREVPTEIQAIVDKALVKDVATRYQHADEMIADLKRLTPPSSIQSAPRRDNWNRYVVTSAVAMLLMVAGYWGVTKFTGKVAPRQDSARKMLAVLPFQNLGSSDDEYFADGITDEITAKLASIHDLGVISHTSTALYKHSPKSLKEIAKELGVDYVLEGTLLWDKGHDTSRVRILPQLIRVSDDTHLWAETYQRPLTDIFATQTDIANKIADAMNLTLLASESAALQNMPTKNLDAYQAYLRGLEYWRKDDKSKENCFLAQQMLQRAVELDSTFALAYANLALVHIGTYWFISLDRGEIAKAKVAADRALALQSNLAWAHAALGYYYYWGFRDYEHALEQFAIAEVDLPNDPEVRAAKAYIWRRLGKMREALALLKQVFLLLPRQTQICNEIAETYYYLREHSTAIEYFNQSIALRPDQVQAYLGKANVFYNWKGETGEARAALESCPMQDNDDMRAATFWLNVYDRNYPSALRAVEQMPAKLEAGNWGNTSKAELVAIAHSLMGDSLLSRVYFDSARVIAEGDLRIDSSNCYAHSSLGIAYAGLGRKADAIREGKRAMELLPTSVDVMDGAGMVGNLVSVYLMVGEYDLALDLIEPQLTASSGLTAAYLRLDPCFDPLRKLARFQKMLEKYGS